MPIRTLLKRIAADELAEWRAYENIECGFPAQKSELYAAQIALKIDAAFGDSKKVYRLGEYAIPRIKEIDKPMTAEQMKMQFRILKSMSRKK